MKCVTCGRQEQVLFTVMEQEHEQELFAEQEEEKEEEEEEEEEEEVLDSATPSASSFQRLPRAAPQSSWPVAMLRGELKAQRSHELRSATGLQRPGHHGAPLPTSQGNGLGLKPRSGNGLKPSGYCATAFMALRAAESSS